MKSTILLLLLMGLCTIVGAQTDTTRAKRTTKAPARTSDGAPSTPNPIQVVDPVVDPGSFMMMRRIDNRYEGVQGTPYFLNDWVIGRIDMMNGQQYDKVPIKYDAHNQNLVLRRDTSRDSIIVSPNYVKQFVLRADDGAEWLFRRYPMVKVNDNDLKNGYFIVLYEGKTSLLKRVSKTFKKADYKDPYSTNVRYDTYKNDFAYYLLRPDNTLTKVKKMSKKSLFDALNDKGANFEAFAMQEKLDFNSDTDFVRVVKYYDSL